EDEDGTRDALHETLAGLGYEDTAVASGEEAGLVPAEPAYDLLLTDQMLPGAAGIDLATGLVDRWPGLAVIVMSGYSEGQVLQQAVRRHQVRFLQKPFDLATLTHEVRAALEARELSRVDAEAQT
ncbi:MAG TPA: response regulator, partial [Thermoanaerobaculaceae bacterium]|nr:response regulator [Thermoanaerobaculaceae bacterium]